MFHECVHACMHGMGLGNELCFCCIHGGRGCALVLGFCRLLLFHYMFCNSRGWGWRPPRLGKNFWLGRWGRWYTNPSVGWRVLRLGWALCSVRCCLTWHLGLCWSGCIWVCCPITPALQPPTPSHRPLWHWSCHGFCLCNCSWYCFCHCLLC